MTRCIILATSDFPFASHSNNGPEIIKNLRYLNHFNFQSILCSVIDGVEILATRECNSIVTLILNVVTGTLANSMSTDFSLKKLELLSPIIHVPFPKRNHGVISRCQNFAIDGAQMNVRVFFGKWDSISKDSLHSDNRLVF